MEEGKDREGKKGGEDEEMKRIGEREGGSKSVGGE